MRKNLPVALLILLAGTAAADSKVTAETVESVGEYQTIIDRQMFGQPPAGFDPMKMPSEVSKSAQKEVAKEQEKLQKAVHFSVINIASDGAAVVGFSDNSDPKKPVHLYLRVGESRGGWMVKAADPKTASATLVKDGVELNMKLGDNSAQAAGTPVPAVMPLASTGARSRGLLNGSAAGLNAQTQTLRSRRSLFRQREAAQKARDEELARREAELNAQREQDRQEREAEQAELREQLNNLRKELRASSEAKAAGISKEAVNENNDAQ